MDVAKRFIRYLANGGLTVFRGQLLIPDETAEYLAELIADDRRELTDAFLRKPRGREPKIHD